MLSASASCAPRAEKLSGVGQPRSPSPPRISTRMRSMPSTLLCFLPGKLHQPGGNERIRDRQIVGVVHIEAEDAWNWNSDRRRSEQAPGLEQSACSGRHQVAEQIMRCFPLLVVGELSLGLKDKSHLAVLEQPLIDGM